MSDSQLIINSITKFLLDRENDRWIGSANRELMMALVMELRQCKGIMFIKKVKGHAGIEGNESADRLANERANEGEAAQINLPTAGQFGVIGAKLLHIMQAKLYEGIIERKLTPHRRGTIVHLDMTRWAIHEQNMSKTEMLLPMNVYGCLSEIRI